MPENKPLLSGLKDSEDLHWLQDNILKPSLDKNCCGYCSIAVFVRLNGVVNKETSEKIFEPVIYELNRLEHNGLNLPTVYVPRPYSQVKSQNHENFQDTRRLKYT